MIWQDYVFVALLVGLGLGVPYAADGLPGLGGGALGLVLIGGLLEFLWWADTRWRA